VALCCEQVFHEMKEFLGCGFIRFPRRTSNHIDSYSFNDIMAYGFFIQRTYFGLGGLLVSWVHGIRGSACCFSPSLVGCLRVHLELRRRWNYN